LPLARRIAEFSQPRLDLIKPWPGGHGGGNDLLGERVGLHLQLGQSRIVFLCIGKAITEPLKLAFSFGELPFRLLQRRRSGSWLIRGRLRLLSGLSLLAGRTRLYRLRRFLRGRRSATGKRQYAD
jgi:hypothetical protein